MAILPGSLIRPTTGQRKSVGRVLILSTALLAALVILLAEDQVASLGAYSFPAIFLVSLLGNAVLLLPAPGLALIVTSGGTLDPLTVGVVAGLGAALGELTGYCVGQSGGGYFEKRTLYWRIEGLMRKSGTLVIFVLAVIPNPLFDIGGLVAGALRMPIWRFLLSVWLGKSLRFALLATIGAMAT